MYILQFFYNLARKGVAMSLGFCNGQDGQQDDEEAPSHHVESAPLSSRGGSSQDGYMAIQNQVVVSPDQGERSLTAEFVSYGKSNGAIYTSIFNLVIYCALAIAAFSYGFEHWPITDSLYFATTIFTTVGFGDLAPKDDSARLFCIFFALYGIVILGVFLGILGESLLEAHDNALDRARQRARRKVMNQFSEGSNEPDMEPKPFLRVTLEIIFAEAPMLAILVMLALPIAHLEGWSAIQGIYWMTITGTTIGFGDLHPSSGFTRSLCLLYIPLAVAVLGECLGRIAGAYMERKRFQVEGAFLERTMTLADLKTMDVNHDGKVSELEFITYMLVAMQKVEDQDLKDLRMLFHRLDKGKSGTIDKQDLVHLSQLNREDSNQRASKHLGS